MMTGRHNLCRSLVQCLAAAATVLALSTPALSTEPDQRLASNPALARIARGDPAAAQRLLGDIEEVLRQPAPSPMRGSFGLGAADEALLGENPLIGEAYTHNLVAELELLKRVTEASLRGR